MGLNLHSKALVCPQLAWRCLFGSRPYPIFILFLHETKAVFPSSPARSAEKPRAGCGVDGVQPGFGRSAVASGAVDPLLLLQNREGGFPAPVPV